MLSIFIYFCFCAMSKKFVCGSEDVDKKRTLTIFYYYYIMYTMLLFGKSHIEFSRLHNLWG